jgi:uncharacterized membrane protein (UPF0127 family)
MADLVVQVFETEAQKQKGLQHMNPIPDNKIFVFTHVEPDTVFHSRNVASPFDICFVDRAGVVLEQATLEPPGAVISAPPRTAYAIEAKEGILSSMDVGRRVNMKALLGKDV